MCGIVGRLSAAGHPVARRTLEGMLDRLAHRGPDGRGVVVDRFVGLGAQRLAILDLSASGRQPMPNEDETVWVVFNGEIYNFSILREQLQSQGHRFRSRTDTEVIVHLYEEVGLKCVERLRGMFAFALWDRRRQRLLLARDRLGEKPLFYSFGDGTFAFASELKALLAVSVSTEVDPVALDQYVAYRYVPHPRAIYRSVRKLPPGHCLLVEGGTIRSWSYWQLAAGTDTGSSGEHELCREIVDRLREAVRLRMVADVPVGAFLSGGIDSSAVVALMADVADEPPRTFTVGFEDGGDEIERARIVATAFGTDHHEVRVRPEAAELLPKLVAHLDEPFGDPSVLPTYYLAQFARRHVKVVLNGEGGDETFAGYSKYWQARVAALVGGLPRPLRGPVVRAAVGAVGALSRDGGRAHSLGRALRSAELAPPQRYAYLSEAVDRQLRNRLYSADLKAAVGDPPEHLAERYTSTDIDDRLNRMLAADLRGSLPDDLLYKVDMATMAHGLEARSPFLDHHFVEFALRIPSSYKVRGLRRKYILKRALRGIVPREILARPKRGFDPPVARWLREDLREMAFDLLLDGEARSRGYFHTPFVEGILHDHVQGGRDWSALLWRLLVLEIWHRQAR